MKDGGGGYNVWATTHQELYVLVAHHRQPQQMDTAWSWMDGDLSFRLSISALPPPSRNCGYPDAPIPSSSHFCAFLNFNWFACCCF
jgi:hypothetical protein